MPLIKLGQTAPDFTLPDQHGKRHTLKRYAGRTVVLYFYPRDESAVCTAEACQFRERHPDFAKVKAVVLGVSPDTVESHAEFDAHHQLHFPLLADVAERGVPKVCAAYGAWGPKSLYGREFVGVIRTTYLIGPDRKVLRRWDHVRTPGHAAEVLNAARIAHSGGKLVSLNGQAPLPKPRKPARQKSRASDRDPQWTPIRTGASRRSSRRLSTARSRKARPAVRGKVR